MLNHTYLKINKNMTSNNNFLPESQKMFEEQHSYCLNILCLEADPIDQFLNDQAFLDRQSTSKVIQESNDLTTVNQAQNTSSHSPIDETQASTRKKSIFHNFQKHLITLIKKFVTFPQSDAKNEQETYMKVKVWPAFKRTRSFNKKVLHMVFGVSQAEKAEEEMGKLAQQYPQFKSILQKHAVVEITEAQTIIRKEVFSQLKAIDKKTLQESCQVNRFEEFYQYFQSFMCELSNGPMAKRMSKNRKHVVVQRLKNRQRRE